MSQTIRDIRNNCEFYVREGIRELEARGIMVDGRYPAKGEIRVVKSGVIFQQYCHDGLKYDVCVSWLQKAIRRNRRDEALYCAAQMVKLGRMFESHCLNRLLLIASEDVGAAEPGIAIKAWELYTRIQEIRDRDRTVTKRLIVRFVTLLCHSRKTRLMDWLLHDGKEGEGEGEGDPIRKLVRRVVMAVEDKTVDRLIGGLVQSSVHRGIGREIACLQRIYRQRKDVLALLHAAQLLHFGYVHALDQGLLDVDPCGGMSDGEVDAHWRTCEELNPRVLDDAIDGHTKDGSKLLKRDFVHFVCCGSLLENWTPFPGEEEAMIWAYHRSVATLGYGRIKTDVTRMDHQCDVIQRLVEGYATRKEQTLEMACGTGKTKTSWWVVRETLGAGFNRSRILVVTPLLGILSQFYESWRDMAITDKVGMEGYIVASRFGKPLGSMYTNYAHVRDREGLEELKRQWGDASPAQLRVLFTTYSSERKVRDSGMEFDFAVYDEAHHARAPAWNRGYALRMSATLGGEADVKYGYVDAIRDGCLVDYTVELFDGTVSEIMDSRDKLIVYCVTNERSRSLHESDPSDYAMRLDCDTPEIERKEILQRFRESPKAVIYNCRVLGEGIDLPECDSIYIESGCTGYVSVIQAMGRCLRLSDRKVRGPRPSRGCIYLNANCGNLEARLSEMRRVDPGVDLKLRKFESISLSSLEDTDDEIIG